jgi:hypothetical protein
MMEKKPLLYESACIFSIAGSSIGFIVMFISTFFFRIVTEKITSITNITATENLSQFYFALLGTAFCVSLLGAINLLRMRRIGLWLYLSAQFIILFLPVYWLGNNSFSVTNAIFTALFAAIYIFNYKLLKS